MGELLLLWVFFASQMWTNASCSRVRMEEHAVIRTAATCANACRDGKERTVNMVSSVMGYNVLECHVTGDCAASKCCIKPRAMITTKFPCVKKSCNRPIVDHKGKTVSQEAEAQRYSIDL